MERIAPTPIYAFFAAIVGGALLAAGRIVSGGILVVLAVVLMVLWRIALDRGEDGRNLY
jgi:hypothetical protein